MSKLIKFMEENQAQISLRHERGTFVVIHAEPGFLRISEELVALLADQLKNRFNLAWRPVVDDSMRTTWYELTEIQYPRNPSSIKPHVKELNNEGNGVK